MSSSSVRAKRRRTGESDTEGSITEPERTNKADAIRPVSESVDGSGNPESISVSGESSVPAMRTAPNQHYRKEISRLAQYVKFLLYELPLSISKLLWVCFGVLTKSYRERISSSKSVLCV